jgi:hypothetical protein
METTYKRTNNVQLKLIKIKTESKETKLFRHLHFYHVYKSLSDFFRTQGQQMYNLLRMVDRGGRFRHLFNSPQHMYV